MIIKIIVLKKRTIDKIFVKLYFVLDRINQGINVMKRFCGYVVETESNSFTLY
jgi:hypothetical protein